MSMEQVLEELKKYSEDFVSVGDAKEFIQNNKKAFLHKWTKVNQYYNYIMRNVEPYSEHWIDAVDIITDIIIDNPSLEEWINLIIDPKREASQQQVQPQKSSIIDVSAFTNKVESFVSEIRNMQSWDPDNIEDIKWQLQECRKILISNQSSFSPQLYQSLIDDIDASLDKIGRFNNMLNSETMESIIRK